MEQTIASADLPGGTSVAYATAGKGPPLLTVMSAVGGTEFDLMGNSLGVPIAIDWAVRWQDRLNLPWSWYACGCEGNRDAISAMRAASFQVGEVRHNPLRWISPVVRPLIVGSASPSVEPERRPKCRHPGPN
jgi:hypothetical protein